MDCNNNIYHTERPTLDSVNFIFDLLRFTHNHKFTVYYASNNRLIIYLNQLHKTTAIIITCLSNTTLYEYSNFLNSKNE